MLQPGCKIEHSAEKTRVGCPKFPCGKVICTPEKVPTPIEIPNVPKPPVSEEEKNLEKHSCSDKAILLYDSCDAKLPSTKLVKGKGHTFKSIKGVVSVAVPEGCKVTLYTEEIRDSAIHADKSSHAAIVKGSKRICVSSVLKKNVVVVGIEDDGDMADVVGTLKSTIQKTKMLEAKLNAISKPAILRPTQNFRRL